ncbi:MAG: DUF167 family protein [Methylobacteriaceae bacterium]|nr:DUF167 family protein [Methylobacteriaceae bacterium]
MRVRVTPRGGRDAIDGVDTLADGTKVLKVRVRAAPQDGEATGAVRRILAGALDVAASAVTLESGAVSRIKIFTVDGDSTLEDALSTLLT